jgi:beta-phosphoglucomutase-like phosphatase (HAD superfamily)
MRDECQPLAGAAGLLQDLDTRGVTIILASSASEDDVERFLARLDADPGAACLFESLVELRHVLNTRPIEALLDR